MSTSEFKSIVERYLKGEASAIDQAMIEAWLAATEDNPVELSEAELQTIRMDMLQHLREQNGYAPAVAPEPEPASVEQPVSNTRVRYLIPWLRRIAVVVICFAGILSLFYYWHTSNRKAAPVAVNETVPATQYRVRITATNAIRRVVLPDSSIVIVNRAGSLYYNMPFDKSTREVFLDAGEAFFEVRKNTARPFVVHATKTVTTVLGTAFNIRISGNVSTVKIVVKTGKVKVAANPAGPDSSRLLQAEQGIEINTSNNNIRTFSQPANITTSWWDGKLVFHQNNMKEVVEALENRYQVHIRLTTPVLQQYRVSGDFTRSHTLTEVLDALCLVHRLSYEKKNNEYFIYPSIKKPVMR
jgi:transmembrane sensor